MFLSVDENLIIKKSNYGHLKLLSAANLRSRTSFIVGIPLPIRAASP